MNFKEKRYLINGRTFVQNPLVLGQLLPLCEIIQAIEIQSFSVQGIITAFGAKLSAALAVLLIPLGETLRDRDIEAMALFLEENMSAETALEVVADFLSFNPASSILGKVKEITGAFQMGLAAIAAQSHASDRATPTPSGASSTTSPTET